MAKLLDAAAEWMWRSKRIGTLLDWLPLAKLYSMQQRKPGSANVEMHTMLENAARSRPLAAALKRYDTQVVEHLGMDALL